MHSRLSGCLTSRFVRSTPSEQRLARQAAAHQSWANTVDRTARTAKARQALLDRIARDVDPENKMSPATRALAVESARKAYFANFARIGQAAKRAKREAS